MAEELVVVIGGRVLPHLQRHIDDLISRLDDPPDPGPKHDSRGTGGSSPAHRSSRADDRSSSTHP